MILALDVGNTTVSFSGIERSGSDYSLVFTRKTDTVSGKTVSFYKNEILSTLKKIGFSIFDFEGAVLSSVVPSVTDSYREALSYLFPKNPVVITSSSETGLRLDVENPEKLGHDRIADAAWVAARYPLPAVTVDMGTATTFNVIGVGGIFQGGAIVAGLETGLWGLSRRTAQLPEVRPMAPEFVVGKNTVECMEVGAVIGSAAMIDGLVSRFEEELGAKVTLVVTGGLARPVEPYITHEHVYDADLLPKGLAYLYDRNRFGNDNR